MNQRIRRTAVIFTMLFVALAGMLTYLQVIAAPELVANGNNGRTLEEERRFSRGSIFSNEGTVLAESVRNKGIFERRYPLGALMAPITGFSSSRYGRSGIEDAANEHLMAKRSASSLREYINELTGGEPAGDDIYLTISQKLQRVAVEALGDRKGAVVALDPRTGDVLAMAGYPTYDPNAADEAFDDLKADAGAPLVNRATQGLYPPGSTFKVVTASAALEKGRVTPSSIYDGPAELPVYGGKVTNFDNDELGKMNFAKAFASSVNTIFAKVGLELGEDILVEQARAFGFDSKPPVDLPATASRAPAPVDDLALAWMAVGQAELEATPLQMALVASAIGNGGEVMRPRLIKEVRSAKGELLLEMEPEVWRRAVSKETATTVTNLMVDAVEKGTGRAARIDAVRVAGKTGTAETGSGGPHAWFIGFAPAEAPEIAVAVIVEHGGLGGRTAAPIAKEVLAAALQR